MKHQSLRKSLGIISLAFLFFAFPGVIQAQTIQNLGEVGASAVESSFKSEIAFLNDEINQNPPNANTEHNAALINGFEVVLKSFFEGDNLQSEFVSFLESGVLQANDDQNTNSQIFTTGNNLGRNNPLQDVIDYVQQWNLKANDMSDLETAFDMIRTIKNQ
jgi:hypothetical protein